MFKIFTHMFDTFETKIKFCFAIIFDANKQRKNNILNKTLSNEQKKQQTMLNIYIMLFTNHCFD